MEMTPSAAERIDGLCQRRCAFALYQPIGGPMRFCMPCGGESSALMQGEEGFLLASFTGRQLFIAAGHDFPPPPDAFPLQEPQRPSEPATTRERYHELFSLYRSWVQGSEPLDKIVLARVADIAAPGFSPAQAFARACDLYPTHFNALAHTEWGTWLCSTPELLLSGRGSDWQTMALAGTRLPSSAKWDSKNQREHLCVVRHIKDCLKGLAEQAEEDGPHTLASGSVQHLCTRIRFQMPWSRLRALLRRLPPTPAVCGYPADKARTLINACPDIRRSCYAGYLGPVSNGSASLYVTLRCLQYYPGLCRLYAGGGLMPDSLEEMEWAETEAKMATMRALLQ